MKSLMAIGIDTNDPFAFDYFGSLMRIDVGKGHLVMGKVYQEGNFDGTPVLFVYGAFHGAWCYALWIRELDQMGWPVSALDQRGHGSAVMDDVFFTDGAEAMADDIVDAVAEISSPPILVGHSLGALLAGISASRVRVAGLGLLTPSPPGQLPRAKTIPVVSQEEIVFPPKPEKAWWQFYPRFQLDDIGPPYVRLTPGSPRLLNDRFLLRVPIDRTSLDAPALCISAGLDDPDLHPEGQDRAVADFFGGTYLHLDEASHCLMLDPDWRVGLTVIT